MNYSGLNYLRHAFKPRFVALTFSVLFTILFFSLSFLASHLHDLYAALTIVCLALCALGIHDLLQTRRSLLRNYPISGHIRYLLENVRPEIRQYFIEDEKTGTPFNHDARALVFQRAKGEQDKRPFGTELHVYQEGYEFIRHTMAPALKTETDLRVVIGADRARPYNASLYNISAMSFGSLSSNAILALNAGARRGGFAHDTGEGGVSPYHLQNGGDLIWEIGSGYFGCRTLQGAFDAKAFADRAGDDRIKMIEIKLSQGAKPGQGGVLPGAKVSAEIAAIRGVEAGVDCVSPARHSAFSTPIELLEFIERLRELSGGKPTGFKLCVGHPSEFLAICKAMRETGLRPDFIVVDGKEGGTGAAPQEFMDHLGTPLRDGLSFVHNSLIGAGLRDAIRIGASGKIVSAFDFARAMALGADWCNAARGYMFALGCIQSLSCHTDRCPTGVATQDLMLQRGLVVADKAERVFRFHRATLNALAELTAATGLAHPREFRPRHLSRRTPSGEIVNLEQLYPTIAPGALLEGAQVEGVLDRRFSAAWRQADPRSFAAMI